VVGEVGWLDPARCWEIMELDTPEIWPGATPWEDKWGSFGTVPDAAGWGGGIQRTRVPPAALAEFWEDVRRRYPVWPRFTVGPRDTPGLPWWLQQHGYELEERDSVLVLSQDQLSTVGRSTATDAVREATTVQELAQVIQLDHLIFGDPLLKAEELASELRRNTGRRRQLFVPGAGGIAVAAGGFTTFARWALLWGGETHPDHRGRGWYHAVVAARLQRLAAAPSLEFAAVYARSDTSAPILRRLGFQLIGTSEVWRPPALHASRAGPLVQGRQ